MGCDQDQSGTTHEEHAKACRKVNGALVAAPFLKSLMLVREGRLAGKDANNAKHVNDAKFEKSFELFLGLDGKSTP